MVLSAHGGEPLTVWSDDPNGQFIRDGVPFRHLATIDTFTDPEGGRQWETLWVTCSAIGEDGRCTIYETRPQLCRDFEPASDPLCVHWRGAEGDERSAL